MSLIKQSNHLKPKKRWRWLVGAIIAIVLIAAFLFFPTNYYLEVPGSAESLKPFVKVAGTKDKAKGSYMLTTVGVVGARLHLRYYFSAKPRRILRLCPSRI